MNIIGRGLQSIVTIDGSDPDRVNKFYLTEEECAKEKTNLKFVTDIQRQGFKLGCKVPELFSSETGQWQANGKTYRCHSVMELIAGKRADSDFEPEIIKLYSKQLGSVIFSMHRDTRKYVEQWTSRFGDKDELLNHLFNDKAAKVLAEEKDKMIKQWTKDAFDYLRDREEMLLSNRTLTHLDLNLPNILLSDDSQVEGLVDWVGFGLTNPTLSMYQLAARPYVWKHVEKQYEYLGGEVMRDILYAAATIHLAWAPIICAELDFPLPEDDSMENLALMYENFEKFKNY